MVVLQQAAQSFLGLDLTIATAIRFIWLNDSVFETLVISFTMVVIEILAHCVAKGALTEEEHSLDAFGFQ